MGPWTMPIAAEIPASRTFPLESSTTLAGLDASSSSDQFNLQRQLIHCLGKVQTGLILEPGTMDQMVENMLVDAAAVTS